MTDSPGQQATSNRPRSAATPAEQVSELEVLIRARYPLVYVVSWEEQRVVAELYRIATRLGKKVFEWSITTGLVAGATAAARRRKDAPTQDPLVALDKVLDDADPGLYVFKDLHAFLRGQNMAVVRALREVAMALKSTYKTIVILSPILELPCELEKEVTIVDFELPNQQHLACLLGRVIEEVKDNPKVRIDLSPGLREKVVDGLLGLTLSEAENVLAKALVQNKGLNEKAIDVIYQEKKQIIRKSGVLEFYEADVSIQSVGGLDVLKDWLIKRAAGFSEQARRFGLPAPKGVLLLGVQGCGKSLSAKMISQLWRLPLLRFDVGRVFGSLVGSSEQNTRRAIQVAESIAPAVLWIDEIDKAFRGAKGSGAGTDAGTAARVFGTFLTWLSEKKKPVFVVATANDVSMLPPELLRKGRFDEIFFVDLPNKQERKEIFKIHLSKRGIDPAGIDLDALANASSGFSGAEIEEAVVAAMFDAFYAKRPVDTELVKTSLEQTVPLSKTMSEEIDELRRWAAGRARPATSPDERPQQGRMLEM